MADYRGIEGVGQAIVHLLRIAHDPDEFGHELTFEVYSRDRFQQPMSAGASLLLYRIVPNGAHRTPPGPPAAPGRVRNTSFPLDLHYLLSFWGREASLQHRIAGWVMRQLEDTPVLPGALLTEVAADVFDADETLQLLPGELSNEDLFRIWEVLVPERGYELSVPYIARTLRVDSSVTRTSGAEVQERVLHGRPDATRRWIGGG